VFFEGRVEKGELPVNEPTQPENPEAPVPPENPEIETPTADAWSAFWDRFAPYTAKLTGENMAFWTLVVLALLTVFSLMFVFFADRNDEVVSLWKSIIKTLLAGAIALVSIWVASFFLEPVTAIIVGLIL
jgi:hypothetical protein